jgi:ribosome-associated protein
VEGHGARRPRRAGQARRDLVVLDVQRVSSVTDYFLICSGKSTTHLRRSRTRFAPSSGVKGQRAARRRRRRERLGLLDYGDVLMHVFLEDTRLYYALERLW